MSEGLRAASSQQPGSVGVRLAKQEKGGPARAASFFLSPCNKIGHELRTNLLASHSLNSFQLAHRTAP